jgi:hypothetical protein
MDKLQQEGQNLGRVFNSRCGCIPGMTLHFYEAKLPNLNLKTRLRQLLGYLLLNIALHAMSHPNLVHLYLLKCLAQLNDI